MSDRPQPLGGTILNRYTRWLLALAVLGGLIIVWRFLVGLGPATGLNDGYPWGIWIAFDVVTGTALACGGYAIALLVYVFNKGKYHPLVRPAILASALGYTLAGLAIAIDVGRPWFIWRVPLSPHRWNLNSALLEVALCVMAYVLVLWIELSPAFMERWKERADALGRFSRWAEPRLEKALLWIIALGILLPTMHQSSLGTMMMLTTHKLHPLWQTPLLPLLFLVGCVAMGYALVVFESLITGSITGRGSHVKMLGGLWGAAAATSAAFIAIRLVDVIWQGELPVLLSLNGYSLLFFLELALLAIPSLMWLQPKRRRDKGELFQSAMLFIVGGALYRFDTYLIAFNPGQGYRYFPTVPELFVTFAFVATEILVYIAIVKRFPILAGQPRVAPAS